MNVFVEMVGGPHDGEVVTLSKTYAVVEFKMHVPGGDEVVRVRTYDRRPETLKYDYRGEVRP